MLYMDIMLQDLYSVQEISISNNSKADKKRMISDILNDKLSYTAIKKGRIESKVLSIFATPMRMHNVSLCIFIGKSNWICKD